MVDTKPWLVVQFPLLSAMYFLEDYSVGINLVLHTSVHFFKITGLDWYLPFLPYPSCSAMFVYEECMSHWLKWFYIPYFERGNPTYWWILLILTFTVCLESQHDCESNHWCDQHGHIWVPRVLIRSERRYMTLHTPVLYCLIVCKCIFS